VIALTAAEVAAATGGRLHPATLNPALVVHGPVVVDSRQVATGSLFVALHGEHSDGHDHAVAAIAAGAALALAAREVSGPDGPVPSVVVADVERALGDLETSAESVRRLTDLFEWAKFSQHEPEPEMRDDAMDALVAVRDELRRPAEAAVA